MKRFHSIEIDCIELFGIQFNGGVQSSDDSFIGAQVLLGPKVGTCFRFYEAGGRENARSELGAGGGWRY